MSKDYFSTCEAERSRYNLCLLQMYSRHTECQDPRVYPLQMYSRHTECQDPRVYPLQMYSRHTVSGSQSLPAAHVQ